MAIHRAKRKAVAEEKEEPKVLPNSPLSDAAMERLAQIMNDTPSVIKLKGTEYKITALKPGTQWLIAEEACKIVKGENLSMGDVIKEFATNLPAVARVLALAMLNDKDRIYSDEYQKIYDMLLWGDFEMRDWAGLLVEILKLIDVDFFFASTNVIQTVRSQTLTRKTQAVELSRHGLSTDR